MNVLVTAATRHGSTMEIATIIAGILDDAGLDTDVKPPDEVRSVEAYEAVVIGSAVYMGRWLEPARDLVARVSGELAGRSVWLFSSGPLGESPKPDAEPADVEAMRTATGAIDHRVFPGRLVKSELGLAEKVVVAGVRAPYGDFRPWDDVSTWARGIADRLRTIDLAATMDIRTPTPTPVEV
jgi:menaquinone-dependent protoporphyrinogen oxidase